MATETDPPLTGADPQDSPGPTANEPLHVFPFDFSDSIGAAAARLVGAWPFSAGVAVSARGLWIRYGPWYMKTTVENVRSAHVVGPLRFWMLGPPHVSPNDNSVTFATTTRRGVCLRFRVPIPGGLPSKSVRHDQVTVTVKDPEGLVALLDTLHRPG